MTGNPSVIRARERVPTVQEQSETKDCAAGAGRSRIPESDFEPASQLNPRLQGGVAVSV